MRRVLVVAALLERDGQLLVARRHDKGERAGLWEFPGGKVEPGENEPQALVRELREELDVGCAVGPLYARLEHQYPDLHVELALYRATLEAGAVPRPVESQEVRWVPRAGLGALPFCEADLPVLARLAAEERGPQPQAAPAGT